MSKIATDPKIDQLVNRCYLELRLSISLSDFLDIIIDPMLIIRLEYRYGFLLVIVEHDIAMQIIPRLTKSFHGCKAVFLEQKNLPN